MSSPPPPDSFLPCRGPPAIPFEVWISMFEVYLEASGLEKSSDSRKRSLLLSCLGTEGFAQFKAIEDQEVSVPEDSRSPLYDAAVLLLRARFVTSSGLTAARAEFLGRSFRAGEDVAEYVAALLNIGKSCRFDKFNLDQAVVTMLIMNVPNDHVRRALLSEESTELTLEKALMLAKQVERKSAEVNRFAVSAASGSAAAMLRHQVNTVSKISSDNENRQRFEDRNMSTVDDTEYDEQQELPAEEVDMIRRQASWQRGGRRSARWGSLGARNTTATTTTTTGATETVQR